MTRWQLYLVLGLVIVGGSFYAGASWSDHRNSAKAQAAQTSSDQHEGAAQTHAAQASDSERQAAANQAAVNDADARVAAAKRELARLQAALSNKAPVSISSPRTPLPQASAPPDLKGEQVSPRDRSAEWGSPSSLPNLSVFPNSSDHLPGVGRMGNPGQSGAILGNRVDKDSLTTAQASVIAAQDQEIAALKLQVSIEHASAMQWKAAYDESQKALALQKAASDAMVRSAQARGVKGQIVRGLEGLALGYLAGRANH